MRRLLRRAWSRLRGPLARMRYAEPAVLKARYTQVVGFLLSVGVTLPGRANDWALWVLAAFTVLAPWLQGRRTRGDVWSQQTIDELSELITRFPGLEEEAKARLQQGLPYWVIFGELEQLAQGRHAAPETGASTQTTVGAR